MFRFPSLLMRVAASKADPATRRLLLRRANAQVDWYARLEMTSAATGLPVRTVEKNLREYDPDDKATEAALNFLTFLKPEERSYWAKERNNSGLYNAVVRGANAALGKQVGEAAKVQPGLKGTSGEDMAQVMSTGGIKWPGMRFDSRVKSFPDIPVVRSKGDDPVRDQMSRMRGALVKRTSPVYPVGDNIYREVGEEISGRETPINKIRNRLWYIARNAVRDWTYSVDAGRYMAMLEDDMGRVVPVDVEKALFNAMPAYPLARLLSDPDRLKDLNQVVNRALKTDVQRWIWSTVLDAADKNVSLVSASKKKNTPVVVSGVKLLDWAKKNKVEGPRGGELPQKQTISSNWQKMVPILQKALGSLRTMDMIDSLPEIQRLLNDKKMKVYDKKIKNLLRDEILTGGPRTASAAHGAMLRLASTLPVGHPDRKALLTHVQASMASRTADDWIGKAVKRPGRLHKFFGIPEDEKIPMSKIDGEIAKLKKKEDRSKDEESLLDALNLAKTFKRMNKGAALSGANLGRMMISAASEARLFHKLNMKQFVDVYEEVGMNLIRLEDTKQILDDHYTPSVADDVAFIEEEIDKGMKFLRGHHIKAMSEALENMTRAYDLVKKVYR